MKVIKLSLMIVLVLLCFVGCKPSQIIGDSTYGYTYGYMKVDYNVAFDKAWKACEKTIAVLKGYDVIPEKTLGEGSITATIENDTVRFYLTYRGKEVTEITVRVGSVGNRIASQLIQDKIKENLLAEQKQP